MKSLARGRTWWRWMLEMMSVLAREVVEMDGDVVLAFGQRSEVVETDVGDIVLAVG